VGLSRKTADRPGYRSDLLRPEPDPGHRSLGEGIRGFKDEIDR
jgi:hypothetical protein